MDRLPEEVARSSVRDGQGESQDVAVETLHGHADETLPVPDHPEQVAPERRLFRAEAVAAKEQQWLGQILLVRPLSFSFLTAFVVAAASALVLFLVLGEYTNKEHVTGQVALDRGLAKLYSPVAGTVVSRQVKEGDKVSKGQTLFVISAERTSSTKGDAQAAIVQQLESRRRSLQAELIKQDTVLRADEAALRQRIRDSKSELAQLEREIATRQERLRLNTENVQRYRTLAKDDMVSISELQDREEDNLDQRVQLETQQRNRISLRKDILSMQNDLRTAPLKASNQLAAIERSIAEIEQETVDNEAHREIVVPAQADGIITAVLVDPGQVVAPTTPLLGLLPDGSKFEARLYVPSRAIGFMNVGSRVLLRYQAFPYQKFGQYSGKIKEISRTALPPSELQLIGAAEETLFRVTVALDSQTVMAYGERVALQDGMQLEADVMVDTRKIYEWVLEPLYSLSGKY